MSAATETPPLTRDQQAAAGTLIPDKDLVERAIRNANRLVPGVRQRWVAVMDVFATGSTHAYGLCRRFGLDPDEMLKGPESDRLAAVYVAGAKHHAEAIGSAEADQS